MHPGYVQGCSLCPEPLLLDPLLSGEDGAVGKGAGDEVAAVVGVAGTESVRWFARDRPRPPFGGNLSADALMPLSLAP